MILIKIRKGGKAGKRETFKYFICIPYAYQIHIRMENKMISARVELDDYANRILGIIKIKFALKDKSEALNKFIELYGEEIMEKEATEEYSKEIIEVVKKHFDKYGHKKMSIEELDRLCEI